MAAIVSTRIARLQAVSPRSSTVGVGLGTVVDYSSLTGKPALGALAAKDTVTTADIVGGLSASNITGLGALALLNTVNGSTQVTNLGSLAYANSIAANQIGAGTLAAGVIYAGAISANSINSGILTGIGISGGSIGINSGTTTLLQTINGTDGFYGTQTWNVATKSLVINDTGAIGIAPGGLDVNSSGTYAARIKHVSAGGTALRIEGHCTSNGNISIEGKYYGDGSALTGVTGGTVTAASIGLGNVNNTADSTKSVSYANSAYSCSYSGSSETLSRGNNHSAVVEASGGAFLHRANGSIYWQSTYNGSDIRLKEDVNNTEIDGLSLLNALRVVDFNWKKDNPNGDDLRHTGFIAQEVQLVAPDAVSLCQDTYLLNKEGLIPIIVKAIQELHAKVLALESK